MFWRKSKPKPQPEPEPTLRSVLEQFKDGLIGVEEYNGAATIRVFINLLDRCEAFEEDIRPYLQCMWYSLEREIKEMWDETAPNPKTIEKWME